MRGSATDILHAQLDPKKNTLLCLDENLAAFEPVVENAKCLRLLSNRFDIVDRLQQKMSSINTVFNDWDLTVFTSPFDCIGFHLSKEKAVNHHIINQALNLLSDNGQLFFIGEKNHGVKSYADKLKKNLGNGNLKKNGHIYTFTANVPKQQHSYFDDQDYQQLREIDADAPLISKPGQFGWNKVDAGSALLIDELQKLDLTKAIDVLDIGCGYGFLSIQALLSSTPISNICLSDNNAAAIKSANANMQRLTANTSMETNFSVIAGDCALQVKQKFDLVLCNPPFHQGFDVEEELTKRFLQSAKDHLKPNGQALFVVNSFIALEKKAKSIFGHCECLHNNKKFKVLQLKG